MTQFAESIVADLRERATEAYSAKAAEFRDELVRAVSVPVQRAGSRILRSRPGEEPRYETGNYSRTIRSEVTAAANSVVASVYTDSILGVWLEGGTSRMAARPHFSTAFQRFEGSFVAEIGGRMFAQK